LVVVAVPAPIAAIGARGAIFVVVLVLTLSLGLVMLPMAVVDSVLEISVVELGLKIRLVDLVNTGAMTHQVARVAGLRSEG
jgi:hypothetical protein